MTESATTSDEAWQPSLRELERRRIRRARQRRSLGIATLATFLVFGALLVGVVSSPGWDTVQEYFFDPHHARESLPAIWAGFWLNVKMFLIAEPLILLLGLALALARQRGWRG